MRTTTNLVIPPGGHEKKRPKSKLQGVTLHPSTEEKIAVWNRKFGVIPGVRPKVCGATVQRTNASKLEELLRTHQYVSVREAKRKYKCGNVSITRVNGIVHDDRTTQEVMHDRWLATGDNRKKATKKVKQFRRARRNEEKQKLPYRRLPTIRQPQ